MAEKPKFNKTSLKAQRDALAKYQKFLPILQLKKMQLQTVIRQMEPVMAAARQRLTDESRAIESWAALLSDTGSNVLDHVRIADVEQVLDNIAGVEVPEFGRVRFIEQPYSLFSTPAWLDMAIESLRRLVSAREELKVLHEKERLLREELRTTTQRVNLFEKKLIPELKENIRKIKIFLGDEETAAVGRAKLAKSKVSSREEAYQ